MPKAVRHLLDVNVLIALTSRSHVHHARVKDWFYAAPRLRWDMCAFVEAGFLRYATSPSFGNLSVSEATALLDGFSKHPGYRYLPIMADWNTLCGPFSTRLYGTKQITDAYLLGLAVREGLVLVTMDKGIIHLAGEAYRKHVLLLEG